MRNASNFVTLLFGFGHDADGTIDDRLAGEAVAVGFVFEAFDFDRGARFEVFHALHHFDDAGAALAVAAAVHHLAHHGVEVDAMFDCLDAQVGSTGSHDFLAFIDKLDVSASDEFGGLLRVHRILKSGCRKLKGERVVGYGDDRAGDELTCHTRSIHHCLKHLNADWPIRVARWWEKIAENPTSKSPGRSSLAGSGPGGDVRNIAKYEAFCNKSVTLGPIG